VTIIDTQINRQREHISLRGKLVISFNQGKINVRAPEKKIFFCHTFRLRPKKVMGGVGGGGLSKNLVKPWALQI